MSRVTFYSVEQPSIETGNETEFSAIVAALQPWGVQFDRLPTKALPEDISNEAILDQFRNEIDELKAANGYRIEDVARLQRGTPDASAMRAKFLSEHTHKEDEARLFVEGQGAFYLRNEHSIVRIICTKGDLILVPKETRHWFDMGPDPYFTAIRFFIDPEGWVGHFTGDPIADFVPRLDG